MMTRQLPTTRQSDLFAAEPTLPAGFAYGEEEISSDDEEALLKRFETLPFKPFEFHGYLGNRHVVSFGWRYDYAGRSLRDSDAIPPFLLPLRDRAAAFAGVAPESLQQILINKYPPGAGIGWHRDKPMFEDIIAISLSSPCVLRFRRKQGLDGNAPQKTSVPARPICCAVSRVGTGSTASPLSIACAIR
jgi:alkylated DNA repair dioxygenase AlkB